jgi:hypothetical protein
MDRRLLGIGLAAVAVFAAFLFRAVLLSVGRVLLAAALIALIAGLAALATRPAAYPRSTVGVAGRVIRRPLPPDFAGDCVECDAPAAGGQRRRFVREFVVLGVPLLLLDDGENAYCPTCAGVDGVDRDATPGEPSNDRQREPESHGERG